MLRSRLTACGAALLVVAAATFFQTAPAGADVVQVSGGAFGYYASLSLFGGPTSPRGPAPEVTLPSTGADPPLTAFVPSAEEAYGPARVVDAGPITVTTGGTLGPGGSVTSSSSMAGNGDPERGPVRYDQIESGCTASESGVTAYTTVTGGAVETKIDAVTTEPLVTETIPESPEPNYTLEGTVDNVGDHFRVVFNEQILGEDGSITVNAMHMYLLGPIAVGEVINAQSRCGVIGTGSPPPVNPPPGSPSPGAPSPAQPGAGSPSPAQPALAAPALVPAQPSSAPAPATGAPTPTSRSASPVPASSGTTSAGASPTTNTARGTGSGGSATTGGSTRSLAATGGDPLQWALASLTLVAVGAIAVRCGRRRDGGRVRGAV